MDQCQSCNWHAFDPFHCRIPNVSQMGLFMCSHLTQTENSSQHPTSKSWLMLAATSATMNTFTVVLQRKVIVVKVCPMEAPEDHPEQADSSLNSSSTCLSLGFCANAHCKGCADSLGKFVKGGKRKKAGFTCAKKDACEKCWEDENENHQMPSVHQAHLTALFELIQKGFHDDDDDNEEMEDCSAEERKTAASADTELLTKQAAEQRKSAVADATTALSPGKAIMCSLAQSITWAPPVVLLPSVLFA